jgi:hypothetical protein
MAGTGAPQRLDAVPDLARWLRAGDRVDCGQVAA